MAKNDKQRLKLVYLQQIFQQETDELHGLTLEALITRLADYGIQAERKALYKDLAALKEYGMDIVSIKEARTVYYLRSRAWEVNDVEDLLRIVNESKSVSFLKKQVLSKRIKQLHSLQYDGVARYRQQISERAKKRATTDSYEIGKADNTVKKKVDSSTNKKTENEPFQKVSVSYGDIRRDLYETVSPIEQMIISGVVGLMTADALGVPVEFRRRESLKADPVMGMRGFGSYDQPAGTWSDDTSMTLATVNALASPFSYERIMKEFLKWRYEAAYTATNEVFDVGITCGDALFAYKNGTPALACGRTADNSNGNGSLMRILPMVFYLRAQYGTAFYTSEEAMTTLHQVSALTHAHWRSKIGCGLYLCVANEIINEVTARLISQTGSDGLWGNTGTVEDFMLGNEVSPDYEPRSLEEIITTGLAHGLAYYQQHEITHDEVGYYERLTDLTTFRQLPEAAIASSGYVVHTLEAALWCLLQTEDYASCVLRAVNLGRDTDTVGAVAGGLAGLYYGFMDIPADWLSVIPDAEETYKLCISMARQINKIANKRGASQLPLPTGADTLLGLIIGDVVGSIYESWAFKSREFPFFGKASMFTDDTVLTMAVMQALAVTAKGTVMTETMPTTYITAATKITTVTDSQMAAMTKATMPNTVGNNGLDAQLLARNTVHYLRRWGRLYPQAGYGGMFSRWLHSFDSSPMDSFGNGAPMRIAPVGFWAKTEEEVKSWSRIVTAVTHNHPEALKGAEALALAIFLLRNGASKAAVKERIERDYYSLKGLTVEGLHDTYHFDVTTQGTMPAVFTVFFESSSFEEAIRNSIYIGGDSDTIAAMVGAMAQIVYGIPDEFRQDVWLRLDNRIRRMLIVLDKATCF